MHCIQQFAGDRRGVTMIEYALIAALVAMVAFAILQTMGTSLSKLYGKVNSKVTAACTSC